MLTSWGERLDKNNILPEYPRPQMRRDSYYNLNGEWDYAITAAEERAEDIAQIAHVKAAAEAALTRAVIRVYAREAELVILCALVFIGQLNHKRRAAVAEKWQRNARVRDQVRHDRDVQEYLQGDLRRHTDGKKAPEAVARVQGDPGYRENGIEPGSDYDYQTKTDESDLLANRISSLGNDSHHGLWIGLGIGLGVLLLGGVGGFLFALRHHKKARKE